MSLRIETSQTFPPPEEIQADIDKLNMSIANRRDRVREFNKSIEGQKQEQIELLALVKNPGIYDPKACQRAADRCDDHIAMYEATIKKERAGIEQLERMVKKLEKNKWLSEQTSNQTGENPQES